MKYIYLIDNTAHEIIPDFDLAFPDIPIKQRFSSEFLAQCIITVSDDVEVKQNYIYNPDAGTFTAHEDIGWQETEETESTEPTKEERLLALEKENELLKAQVKAQSERNDFMEDCIAEISMQVYAQ